MQIQMTLDEINRARGKLYHFFPELSVFSDMEFRSYSGDTKSLVFFLENPPCKLIKCLAMDFTNEVVFYMQIYTDRDEHIFTDPNGVNSNYIFSVQPGMQTSWASQCKFIPQNEMGDEMMMHLEIPFLKQNGMGFVIFANDGLNKCDKSEKLKIKFSFPSVTNMPKRFTIYILR